MSLISRYRLWMALRQAKKEEQKHVPTDDEIEKEQAEFTEEAKKLKTMINKEVKSKSPKTKRH